MSNRVFYKYKYNIVQPYTLLQLQVHKKLRYIKFLIPLRYTTSTKLHYTTQITLQLQELLLLPLPLPQLQLQ